jgi:hypothetical protein
MIRFESRDLIYVSLERKTRKKQSPVSKRESVYHIIQFLDHHTRRAVYFYDFSGIEPDLQEGCHYYAKGYVNFNGRNSFLVLDGLAIYKNGVMFHINKDLEGITKIETKAT